MNIQIVFIGLVRRSFIPIRCRFVAVGAIWMERRAMQVRAGSSGISKLLARLTSIHGVGRGARYSDRVLSDVYLRVVLVRMMAWHPKAQNPRLGTFRKAADSTRNFALFSNSMPNFNQIHTFSMPLFRLRLSSHAPFRVKTALTYTFSLDSWMDSFISTQRTTFRHLCCCSLNIDCFDRTTSMHSL